MVVGVDGPVRDEAVAAAERAGLPVRNWIERAVRKARAEGLEPAPPAGMELGELEALVRRVVAEELEPVKEALARPGEVAAAPNPPAGGAQSNLLRMRMRRHRVR
jgi:hypothetical protein